MNLGGAGLENAVVRDVRLDVAQARIIVADVPDRPGAAARIFDTLAQAGINIDMIVQDDGSDGVASLAVTLCESDRNEAVDRLTSALASGGGGRVARHAPMAKLTVLGLGMKSHAWVAANLFTALAGAGVNLDLIGTSEDMISVVIEPDRAEAAAAVARRVLEVPAGERESTP